MNINYLNNRCPVCLNKISDNGTFPSDNFYISCTTCGVYKITREAIDDVCTNLNFEQRMIISNYITTRQGNDLITYKELNNLIN